MPKIGYGSNAKTRHVLPNGYKEFVVHNEQDVQTLLMANNKCVVAFLGSIFLSVEAPC